jgi:hypothetical protein
MCEIWHVQSIIRCTLDAHRRICVQNRTIYLEPILLSGFILPITNPNEGL